jgi:predicted LPLAT superfamily acyltransferase
MEHVPAALLILLRANSHYIYMHTMTGATQHALAAAQETATRTTVADSYTQSNEHTCRVKPYSFQ